MVEIEVWPIIPVKAQFMNVKTIGQKAESEKNQRDKKT